ncbi:hypothetical protein P3T36_000059 [Kitasatospora sp. MAP12-15]|nr:hypothetical protein [Kitasatospora sp. MAP12-44]
MREQDRDQDRDQGRGQDRASAVGERGASGRLVGMWQSPR